MTKTAAQGRKPKAQSERKENEDENEAQGKYVRVKQPLLQLNKSGGIKKSKKPVSALTIENNKKARLALATGEVSKDEQNRRADRDLRTLYIRFKSSDSAPKTNQDVFALEKSIQDVRIPRQGKASDKHNIRYCFVEFSDESTCESMKDKLAANPDYFVDFVGEKSKGKKENTSAGNKDASKKMPINPVRLHVTGFGKNLSQEKLQALFPKSKSATIPKGISHYGFVEFHCPADAKAAFDAANKLKVDTADGTQAMTVVFARLGKHNNVPKPEDKMSKKRKTEEKTVEVETVQDDATNAKKAKTEEKADKTNNDDQVKQDADEEEQSESEEDIKNDEVDKDDVEDTEVETDKVEQKEDKNDEVEEEDDDDNDEVENDKKDDDESEEDEEEDDEEVENDKSDDDDSD